MSFIPGPDNIIKFLKHWWRKGRNGLTVPYLAVLSGVSPAEVMEYLSTHEPCPGEDKYYIHICSDIKVPVVAMVQSDIRIGELPHDYKQVGTCVLHPHSIRDNISNIIPFATDDEKALLPPGIPDCTAESVWGWILHQAELVTSEGLSSREYSDKKEVYVWRTTDQSELDYWRRNATA